MVCKRLITLSLVLSLGLAGAARADGEPKFYLFPKTIEMETQIGPIGKTMAYGVNALWTGLAFSLFWFKAHSPIAASAYGAYCIVRFVSDTTGYSLLDLQTRKWWQMNKVARSFTNKPGIRSVWLLSSGQNFLQGNLYQRNVRSGFLLVDAEKNSPALKELTERLGAPLLINKPKSLTVTLRLKIDDKPTSFPIILTLQDLLEQKSLESYVGLLWRNEAKKVSDGRLSISAQIDDNQGSRIDIDRLLEGDGVKSILGLTFLTKAAYRINPFRKSRLGSLAVKSKKSRCRNFMDTIAERIRFPRTTPLDVWSTVKIK